MSNFPISFFLEAAMRLIEVNDIKTGMKLAKTIYSLDGRMLLSRGTTLKRNYIDKLKELGIYGLYIDDEISNDIKIDDVISEETRLHARVLVKKVMDDISNNRHVDLSQIGEPVNRIIDELVYNKNVMVNMEDVRSIDSYTFSHSVNVCVLSIITGINLGYNQLKLKELGMGALLHDIGKTKVSQDIIKKPGSLSPEEFEEMKKHTVYGHEILKPYPEIGYTARFIVLAHHERFDGTGYPLGIKGKEIHDFARIVAVADVYDALTSDRVYRRRIGRDQAIGYIASMEGKHFDREIIKAFLRSIPIYPLGAIVLLSTREKAIVADVNKDFPTRPLVRVIEDEYGNKCKVPKEIDLSKVNDITILQVCNDI